MSLLRGAARAATTIDQTPDSASELVRTILSSAGWTARPPTDTGAVRGGMESLSALVSLCDEVVATNPAAGLPDIIGEIARREEAQDAPSVDGVTLASLHAAKGMGGTPCSFVGLSTP